MKICALVVPKEMKLEHSGDVIKAMTDEELDAALEALRDLLAQREAAANAIEGSAEPVALPAPEAQSPQATPEPTRKHKTNRLMREADTAVGLLERKSRMAQGASPASAYLVNKPGGR